jgi:pectate lyase
MRFHSGPPSFLSLAMLLLLGGSRPSAAQATPEQRDQARLDAVSQYATTVLREARDRFRKQPSPLLVNGIDVVTKEPLHWRFPDGREAIVSDFALQQNFMRVLAALSNLTGDARYKSAALDCARYYFGHYQDQGGLLQWGGHLFVDLGTLKAVGPSEKNGVHELKNAYPYYELLYEADPAATRRFIRAFWNAHVYDWRTLEISRHGQYGLEMRPVWSSPFDNPAPFFETKGLSFLDAGNDLIYSAAMLFKLAGDKDALLWSKRLAEQYVKARNPKTGLGAYQYTQPRKTASTTDDKVTLSWYGDRAKRQFGPEFGAAALEGNMLVHHTATTIYSENALMQLALAESLGPDARELLDWTREGLAAYAHYAYVPETNRLKPMLSDGTDLSDYVLKRDGYYGKAGDVLRPFPATGELLVAYARGFRLTGDARLWTMARSIARANGLGDIGTAPGKDLELNLATRNDDALALFAVLEMYRQARSRPYLDLARVLGDNLVKSRLHHGYFTPAEDSRYASIDAIEPYALLALEATIRDRPEQVAVFINGSGYLAGAFRFSDGSVRGVRDEDLYGETRAR